MRQLLVAAVVLGARVGVDAGATGAVVAVECAPESHPASSRAKAAMSEQRVVMMGQGCPAHALARSTLGWGSTTPFGDRAARYR